MKDIIIGKVYFSKAAYRAIDVSNRKSLTSLINNQAKLKYAFEKSGYIMGKKDEHGKYNWRVMSKPPKQQKELGVNNVGEKTPALTSIKGTRILAKVLFENGKYTAMIEETGEDVSKLISNDKKLKYAFENSGFVIGKLDENGAYSWRVTRQNLPSINNIKINSNIIDNSILSTNSITAAKERVVEPERKSLEKEGENLQVDNELWLYYHVFDFEDDDPNASLEDKLDFGYNIIGVREPISSISDAEKLINRVIKNDAYMLNNQQALVMDNAHPKCDISLDYYPMVVDNNLQVIRFLLKNDNGNLVWKDVEKKFSLPPNPYQLQFNKFGGVIGFINKYPDKIPIIGYDAISDYYFDLHFSVSIDEIRQFGDESDIEKGIIFLADCLMLNGMQTPIIITPQNLIVYDPSGDGVDGKEPSYVSIPLANFSEVYLTDSDDYNGSILVLYDEVETYRAEISFNPAFYNHLLADVFIFLEHILNNLYKFGINPSKDLPYFSLDLNNLLILAM